MKKLEIEVSAGQVLKSATVNAITSKVDEIVDEVNKLPDMDSAIKENRLLIDAQKGVDISQAEFEALQASGSLDPTKTYYIYEE